MTIRALVIRRSLGVIRPRIPIGKTVDSSAVSDQLPLDLSIPHFLLECEDFLRLDERIVRSVKCQYSALDVPGVSRSRCIQSPVKAHDSGNVSAAACEFEDGGSAE